MNEDMYVKKGHGKWSQEGVPHKGWVCIDIEDMEEASETCEMCESQQIRYVHHMRHKDYPDILSVGCICAGNMEENYSRAKSRDDFMRKRASKRLRWIDHRNWKISRNGNDFIKTDGYIIVMMDQGKYWKALIKSEDGSFEKWSERKYESIKAAKLAAFDYLTKKILAENNA